MAASTVTAALFVVGYIIAYLLGLFTYLLSDEGKAVRKERTRNRDYRRWRRRFDHAQEAWATQHGLATYTPHKAVSLLPDIT